MNLLKENFTLSMSMGRKAVCVGVVFLSLAGVFVIRSGAQSQITISIQDRMMITSKIYLDVSTFFPSVDQGTFDGAYRSYLGKVINIDDRRGFDMESMALVATLNDGHTWFYDKWLDENYGQSVGFFAFPAGDKWAVRRSELDAVKVGDVITAIDGVAIQEFFAAKREYISGSSVRDTELSLFMTPVVFPFKFTVTFSDGRRLVVDRAHDNRHESPALKTEGKWIKQGSVAYLKLPGLRGFKLVADAMEYVRQFKDANTIILDVRGNEGGGNGRALQDALMDKPYSLWTEHSNMQGGALLRAFQGHHPPIAELSTAKAMGDPERSDIHFKGRLLLLIDRECTCACEDFVMPFKITHRALLLGETTAGTFSSTHFTGFDNGMMLNVAAIRNTFPDGSRFEGAGISPDIEINITPEDLKAGRDPVLEKAIQASSIK